MMKRELRASVLLASAALLMAPPAFAQVTAPAQTGAVICQGQPAEWIGVTEGASDVSSGEVPISAQVSVPVPDLSYLAFRVTQDQQAVRVEAAAVGQGDPALTLMTPDGDTIGENDDAGGGLSSRIEQNLGPGTYCVSVVSVDSNPLDAVVQVSRSEQQPLFDDEAGSEGRILSCTTATDGTPLTSGALNAALAGTDAEVSQDVDGNDMHYLRFSLTEPLTLSLQAKSDGLDPEIALFDSAGEQIASNDDSDGSTDSRLDFPDALTSGDYCLGVAALSPGAGTITVSAAAFDANAFLQAAYKAAEISPPRDGSVPIEAIDVTAAPEIITLIGKDAHWFGFTTDRPAVYIFTVTSGPGNADTLLRLFAEDGSVVMEADDNDGSLDPVLGPVLIAPGKYTLALVKVADTGSGWVSPVRMTLQRFVSDR